MVQEKVTIINPFKINIDPMERLLLVNFEGDPDTIYIGFEPQVFNDAIHGKGHLVIGWRRDGKVDVYHQPGLKLERQTFDIVGKGLATMVECDFFEAHYEVNDVGVHASYNFKDLYNRHIVIKVNENNPKRRKPFGLLAPMGAAAENPSAMPLVLLHHFYFVRKKGTEIDIRIEDKVHKPDELPLPMDGSKMLYTRYSPEPLIVTFNPNVNAEIIPLEVNLYQEKLSHLGYDYEFEWIKEQPIIKRIICKNDTYPVTLFFKEGFFDIRSLKKDITMKGSFEIAGNPTVGSVKGHYTVKKDHNKTKITLVPSGGWKPRPTKLSLFFLYTVAKMFKNWPKTYEWTAYIQEKDEPVYHMQSVWKRTS